MLNPQIQTQPRKKLEKWRILHDSSSILDGIIHIKSQLQQ